MTTESTRSSTITSNDIKPDEASSSFTPSATEKEASRVIPRVSFRLMLMVVTVCAILAFTYRQSLSGSLLANAIVYSLASLVISFAAFAILFLIAWLPAVAGRDQLEDINLGSPFSSDQLPKQWLPPREPGA